MTTRRLESIAADALQRLQRRGFAQAQAQAAQALLTEVNIDNNQPSLLRSSDAFKLTLVGITGARRAQLEWPSAEGIDAAVDALWADAQAAPPDEAHSVSAGQQADIVQGPQAADAPALADKAAELLDWCRAEAPAFMMKEGQALHQLQRSVLLTSGGSRLASSVGAQTLVAFGSARDGERSSSFNYAGGQTHDLSSTPAPRWFGIDAMVRDLVRSTAPQPIGARFEGEVVFTPAALQAVLQWLLGQLGDERLIARQSLYLERIGERIAAPGLTLQSRFDAPGVAAVSMDAYATPAVRVIDGGALRCLIPSAYGAKRTGTRHVPTAAAGGWELLPGAADMNALVAGVRRGALVDRLSMGVPAANGDFAGVIKNSFLIEGGSIGPALKETMIAGNMATLLQSIDAISRERIDTGAWCLPWVRAGGLKFS